MNEVKVEFCPKCGRKMDYKVESGDVIAECPLCGYKKKISVTHTQEKYKTAERVVIIDKELTPMPTANIECPKCGFKEAYVWSVQTRSGDESETQFFRCKRCGYTWRLYT